MPTSPVRKAAARAAGLLFLAALVGGAALAPAEPGDGSTPPDPAVLKELHRGKAGVYAAVRGLDVSKQELDLFRSHPHLDAVVLNVTWREVEPRKGVYSFGALEGELKQWARSGKGVVVKVILYGQTPDDAQTPPWVYEQPGVKAVRFQGGGVAKGREVRIPAVWEKGFTEERVEPLVKALAGTLDGCPGVWYVVPALGDLGHFTAQPSKDGARALTEAGWTPEKWTAYCRRTVALYRKHFQKTPLFLVCEGGFARDPKHDKYRAEAAALLTELGKQGVAMTHFNLEARRGRWTESVRELHEDVAKIIPDARAGVTRLGMGDDWPLWVPKHRRDKGPTLGHDDRYFQTALDYAFGGLDGIPPMPTTILLLQEPEVMAAHPLSKDHHAAVEEALKQARARLKKVDAEIHTGK